MAKLSSQLLPLSLEKSILLALENNVEIVLERLNPQIGAAEVTKERGAFDPKAAVDVGIGATETATTSLLAGTGVASQKRVEWNSRLRTRIPTGGGIDLEFKNRRISNNSAFQTVDPVYGTELSLTVTHPLLRNFGIGTTTTRIKVAQNNLGLSRHQLESKVMKVVADVQNAYWDLVLAIKNYNFQQASLRQARELERKTRAFVAEGRLPRVAILQARVSVADEQVRLLVADNAVRDAHNRLLMLISDGKDLSGITIVPTDEPTFEKVTVSFKEGVAQALARRPEIAQAKLDVENKRLSLAFARNQRLPTLNVTGTIGLTGTAGSVKSLAEFSPRLQELANEVLRTEVSKGGYFDALEELFSGDFLFWNVGISFEVPLGNRTAKGNMTRAQLEVLKSRLRLESVERQIRLEIDSAVRRLHVNAQRVDAARVARALAAERLKAEEEKFDLGMVTVDEVSQARQALTLAHGNEIKAIVDYQKSLIRLQLVTGTILERHQIVF
jgi:outer membrane protein TolC